MGGDGWRWAGMDGDGENLISTSNPYKINPHSYLDTQSNRVKRVQNGLEAGGCPV